MGKLFGTDGIRGVANETLTPELAYRIGCAAAIVLKRTTEGKPSVLIGRDTRISGDMLENALTAGLCAYGADVMKAGVLPTPAVAYLATMKHCAAGVVISASHNPYQHNGIKFFSGEGYKLSDEAEAEMEDVILAETLPAPCTGAGIGKVLSGEGMEDEYVRYIASTSGDISHMRVLVDCANGASSHTAKKLFALLGADAEFIHCEPDGVNINTNCGSTNMKLLSERVKEGDYRLGIAFDGDADRCLAVDENGTPVDGDQIMAVCAKTLTARGELTGSGFVATVMSNLGLHKYCRENSLRLLCAQVGDRNVLELMKKEGMVLGGEQSGHVIFLNHMTTGDGELTAVQLMSILKESGKQLSELTGEIKKYPQVLLNVPGPVKNEEKAALIRCDSVAEAVRKAEEALNGKGRVLLRPSGTEALIRVMVEAETEETANLTAKSIAEIVQLAIKNN